MFQLLIIFSLLLTTVVCCNEPQFNKTTLNDKLENYKWKKRIVLLISKEENNFLINAADKFFINQKCKNAERNLELLKIKKDNSLNIKKTSNFKDKTGIWLIGYDGNIKGYSEDDTLLLNLYNLIDSMPIRKDEMKNFNKNC